MAGTSAGAKKGWQSRSGKRKKTTELVINGNTGKTVRRRVPTPKTGAVGPAKAKKMIADHLSKKKPLTNSEFKQVRKYW